MSDKNAAGMMDKTIEKIKTLVDANTIIGTPITVGDVTVIPVSKVTYGFAAGGSDLPSKHVNRDLFGGGGGAGITIEPIGFLSIANGQVKMLPMNVPTSTIDRVVDNVPATVDKVSALITTLKTKKEEKKAAQAAEDEADELAAKAAEEIGKN